MIGLESLESLEGSQNFLEFFFEKRTEHRYSLLNLPLIGI